MNKIRVGILFGGKSVEHEVSLQSAKNIIDAIDKDKYEIILIGIDKQGNWHLNSSSHYLLNENDPKLIKLNNSGEQLGLIPGREEKQLVNITGSYQAIGNIDVIFPVIHGTGGEDGTMQGFLKLANIPFVGPGVLGSAVCMDKDVAKRLLRDAGIPVSKFLSYTRVNSSKINFSEVKEKLGLPVFIKPANSGSSVGVSKAADAEQFARAVSEAFKFDTKILIEEYVKGREIECSVLGNENPEASVAGEVVAQHDFYSYDAKYIDDNGAVLKIPTDLPDGILPKIQEIAIESFKILGCEGMARVDFFLTEDNRIYVNELNTIPGFTKISMYPKLWEASGLSYSKLIDRLIELALERYEVEKSLKTSII
jgi:D-alanine-D-alanine ligase